MVQTIGNPFTWAGDALFGAGRNLGEAAEYLGAHEAATPQVQELDYSDLKQALRAGLDDFTAMRSDVMFLVILYPIIGIFLAFMAFDRGALPLLFPMASGFALLGPVAGIGLYEMSRQKEAGRDINWLAAIGVLRSKIVGPVLALALYLLSLFAIWMFVAFAIYAETLGPEPPASVTGFISDVLTTGAGWTMIIVGVGAGAVFATMVLVMSLTSFPMLIDRRVGLPVAVTTSIRVAQKNPGPVAAWGAIVAGLMALGSVPVFLGLVVVMPILGHATWHLYRAAIVFDDQNAG